MKRMDCVAGCSLHPVSALICLTSEDDSSSLIMFAGVHYVCKPVEPLSKSNVEMIVHSIDCQMCGVLDEKLIPDSCTASFSLTKSTTISIYDVSLASVLGSPIGLLALQII